ncbi:uncharacterized protein [Argopecten irradians]|uniref:uncharacterized protein isoform X1 n=1 Tax=Argopecten irradians TaxID=31199 RepID=UPI0037159843
MEDLNVKVPLLDDLIGRPRMFYLNGVLRADYTIYNLESEGMYLVNFDLSLCFETSSCEWTAPILKNSLLPKQSCDWNRPMADPGFSLAIWKSSVGAGAVLTEVEISRLLNVLEVGLYLLETPCNVSISPYTPAVNGWNTTCTEDVGTLPTLPLGTSCHLSSLCTEIDCCSDVPTIQRNIHYKVHVDTCKKMLFVGIEAVKAEIPLFDYKMGETWYYKIRGTFIISYNIVDLFGSKKLRVSVSIQSCFTAGSCDTAIVILDSVELPKPLCDWDYGYAITGFSIDKWRLDNSVETDQSLDPYQIARLLRETEVSTYLYDNECSFASGMFSSAIDGWHNECPTVQPPNVDDATCYLSPDCTEMECCMTDMVTNRNIHYYVRLDPCANELNIGIEKLAFNVSLYEYNWGEMEELDIGGVFRIGVTIQDLTHEDMYLVSVDLSLCWDSAASCGTVVTVLDNTQLHKQVCTWARGFPEAGFSLTQWFSDTGHAVVSSLTGDAKVDLMEVLDLPPYLNDLECDITGPPYFPQDSLGWNISCSHPISVPDLHDDVNCHIGDTCGSVDCCVRVTTLGRYMQTYIYIDPCTYDLTVRIEKFGFTTSLHDYTWGSTRLLYLNGVIRLELSVDDLFYQNQFLLSLYVSVCFESAGPCVIDRSAILENTLLDRLPCVTGKQL